MSEASGTATLIDVQNPAGGTDVYFADVVANESVKQLTSVGTAKMGYVGSCSTTGAGAALPALLALLAAWPRRRRR